MQTWQMVAIGVAAIVIIAAVGWVIYEQSRSRRMRDRFGSEYDRRVAEVGNRRRAESELAHREARVRELKSQPLSMSDRTRFSDEWRICQAKFVDDPEGAVEDADRLVGEIMHARGYAMKDPSDRLADVCAAYPDRASDYREANDILINHRRGQASTEDLRKAFVHFRSLFDEMLGGQDEELKRAS
jgi:hypothetical protein